MSTSLPINLTEILDKGKNCWLCHNWFPAVKNWKLDLCFFFPFFLSLYIQKD